MRSIKHFTNEPLPPCILQIGAVRTHNCDITNYVETKGH